MTDHHGKIEYQPMSCSCCKKCKGIKMPNGLPVCIYGGPFEGYYDDNAEQAYCSTPIPGWDGGKDTDRGSGDGSLSQSSINVSTQECEDAYYRDLQFKRRPSS